MPSKLEDLVRVFLLQAVKDVRHEPPEFVGLDRAYDDRLRLRQLLPDVIERLRPAVRVQGGSVDHRQEGFVHAGTYSDPGFTGANMERPALQRMLSDVKERHLDMVITYKIDRLTRSPRDFYHLIEILETHQAGFISVTERFDTSTPSGRLLRNVMLTFGQFERELAAERVRDKITQKVLRGLYHGGRPPLGYKSQDGRLVVVPAAADVAMRVFETYVETRSLVQAQKVVVESGIESKNGRAFGNSMVWHFLRNSVLTGKLVHKGKVFPGQHEAIISQPLFDHVQKIISEQPRHKARPYLNMPFGGLVECQECGSVMSASHVLKKARGGDKRYYYYRCSSVNHRGWDSCSTRQINADRFHMMMEQNFRRWALDDNFLMGVVYGAAEQTRREGARGPEPIEKGGGYSMQQLKISLKNFNGMWARKTGIEKTLLVQEGIKKVRYSKESVGIEFYWERFIDGETPSAPAAAPGAAAPHKQAPGPLSRTGGCSAHTPHGRLDTTKVVFLSKPLRTINVIVPNQSHNYWAFYHSEKGAGTV